MSSLIKKITKPAAVVFILFGIGITFFGIGVLNPVPSLDIDPNFGLGVLFFSAGILLGFIQAVKSKRKRR